MAAGSAMVVLADSRKFHGHCVAGRLWQAEKACGSWLRPVAEQLNAGLNASSLICSDGLGAGVLDVVGLDLGLPAPYRHQSENRTLKAGRWERMGRIGWNELENLSDSNTDSLWLDGHSSMGGQNDRVPESFLDNLASSLMLIRVEKLALSSGLNPYGRRALRGRFARAGRRYDFAVTDPFFWEQLPVDSSVVLDEAYVCLSLGLPFEGNAYKLIAAVITPSRARKVA